MRIRGAIYWKWADPTLRSRTHDEEFNDGTTIDVQARLSPAGITQLFIGLYSPTGVALYEETCDCPRNESITRALAWGIGKARFLAEQDAPDRLKSPKA